MYFVNRPTNKFRIMVHIDNSSFIVLFISCRQTLEVYALEHQVTYTQLCPTCKSVKKLR